jgi:ATP-dependent helicase/DNAse subunit B
MTKLKIVDQEKPLKLSVTAISNYQQCHRKWYYQFLEKPVIEKKDWSHLILGNFVHDVLEHFHNELTKHPESDKRKLIAQKCNVLLADSKYANKIIGDIRKTVKEILAQYISFLEESGVPYVVESERQFEIYVDDKTVIRGKIDRIDYDESTSTYHIVDYKTGKSKKLDETQLLTYGISLLSTNPEVQVYNASYLMLKEGMKQIPYRFTKTDVDRAKADIISVATDIRNDRTWDANPQFLCKWCDYANICDAYTNSAVFCKTATKQTGEIDWD